MISVNAEELQELKNYKKSSMCIKCGNKTKAIVYHPCVHFLHCGDCAFKKDEECPKCEEKIGDTLDIRF
uniref:RING-type domain-containing protein n=1 Tax=Panagrolaimus sp. JU765 TaxID=591449 RepID=A0AC34Q6S0_9BILA